MPTLFLPLLPPGQRPGEETPRRRQDPAPREHEGRCFRPVHAAASAAGARRRTRAPPRRWAQSHGVSGECRRMGGGPRAGGAGRVGGPRGGAGVCRRRGGQGAPRLTQAGNRAAALSARYRLRADFLRGARSCVCLAGRHSARPVRRACLRDRGARGHRAPSRGRQAGRPRPDSLFSRVRLSRRTGPTTSRGIAGSAR